MIIKTVRLSEDDIDTLTSYADGESRIMCKHKINSVQLWEAALNHNVEKCIGCGWWAGSGEMLPYDSDTPDGHCCNCR